MFDVITSLGYNCEISFRLENYFGSINAMPFSWSFVLEREKFPQTLNDIDRLFANEVELLEDNMICCKNCNIKFHPRYDVLLKEGSPTKESIQMAEEELRQRVSHLKNKWKELFSSQKTTVFLMKVENKGENANLKYIQDMYQVLQEKYLSGKFTLVVLLEREAATEKIKALESERLKVRTLKRFAPKKHTDTMGDVWGWWKVLNEITGEKCWKYFWRLWKKRVSWFIAVMKKYAGIGKRGGH